MRVVIKDDGPKIDEFFFKISKADILLDDIYLEMCDSLTLSFIPNCWVR